MSQIDANNAAPLDEDSAQKATQVSGSFVQRATYNPGDVIFRAGDMRDHAYIIENGDVAITAKKEDGSDSHVIVSAGALFGESAIIEEGVRGTTAIAKTQCEVFILSRDVLRQRMSDLDPLVSLLVSMLIDKYRQTRIKSSSNAPDSAESNALRQHQQEVLIAGFEQQKQTVLKELQVEQELRRALERKEFVPYLQPIVNMATCQIIGFETLIRWHHPEKGVIFPDNFIPVAERTNVVQLIDQRMLEAACDLIPVMHQMLGESAANMFISVNLSGANFENENVVQMVQDTLGNTEFDPNQIKLEITESALVGDSNMAASILENLKKLGVSISLDDFGTGYSSLDYLHKFSIDGLKIDRSFVQHIHDSERSLDIIKAVVGLAEAFKLGVIAEGIEESKDIDILRDIGCEHGQGYHFGRPIEASKALELLKANNGMAKPE
jgi:EAL domain-containing protein (putative c-di-GMP-specific phosphodiesterase class I)